MGNDNNKPQRNNANNSVTRGNDNNNNNNRNIRGFAQSYNELNQRVTEANTMASVYTDSHGRKLKFELFPRKYNDIIIPFLWKVLVHIRVSKDPPDSIPPKLLSFEQFSVVHRKLTEFGDFSTPGAPDDPQPSSSGQNEASEKECTICMEREATLVLPCCHSFCEQCIKLWRSKSETCPVCRVTMEGQTEDCFVLTNPPTTSEVKSFFSEFFDNLQGLDFGD
eukprot:Phypoly_transcript_17042.p1 GENE.Phypoly_transcript_17042~~Phypoly_transcript_17042.p1  ORF type:complete len:222 (+),score=31.73 Phypoly_transcript_17042:96-761(+)